MPLICPHCGKAIPDSTITAHSGKIGGIFTVPVEEIPTVFPLMTVLGGEIVVLREEFAGELGMAPVGHQIEWTFERDYNFGPPLDPSELM